MNSSSLGPRTRPDAAFTLVEIMFVVVIIGLMAAIAIPTFGKVRRAAQNNRFISDLRTFAQAFETYSMENGTWPSNAGTGVIPAGIAGDFRAAAWQTQKNSVGGRWNWDRNNSGVAAAIATTGVTATDAQMTLIDQRIDDGDLSTGLFRKVSTRFIYILEE